MILGGTGKNLAAGMSGGIAYVLDTDHSLYRRLNKDMVNMEELKDKYDIGELKEILEDYEKETGSRLAGKILKDFDSYVGDFKKIIPRDYQKMLQAIGRFEEQGLSRENAELEAFSAVTTA